MVLDRQRLEDSDCGFRCALRLQERFKDVDVVIAPLEVLDSNAGNLLEHLVGIEDGLRSRERVRGPCRGLAFDKGERVRANTEPFEVGSGALQVDLAASRLTSVISRIDWMRGIVTLSPTWGSGGGSGTSAFLWGLAMTQPA